ncbi:MAG: mechanosensitive ion channel family protein [Chloroflexi bacterium]|nr:mechanosensitive ion channel family protein [Chloroflexota bacterium]
MAFTFLGLEAQSWVDLGISLLIVVGVATFGRWVIRIFLDKIVRRVTKRTVTKLDDVLIDTLRWPLYGISVIFATQIALTRLDFLPISWDAGIDDIFFVLYGAAIFIFVWRAVVDIFSWYGKEIAHRTETDLDEQLMPFIQRIAVIILWLIGIITLLGHYDVDVTAMVTTLGIGSLAIALAAQATLADMIAGFSIMIDRPFRIGDRIQIQELTTWGDVVDIGLRSSRIRTRDNRMVIIPNSVINKSLIVNYSFPDTTYRIQIQVGVAYGTDLELARRTMIEAVRNVEGVLPDQKVEALFLEFGPSELVFRVRWWLDSYTDTRRMFDRVNSALYNALNKAGIEIPFPQLGIRHREESQYPINNKT